MVRIEIWEELIARDGNIPTIDSGIYYNSPNSIKFLISGTINGNSGIASSYDFVSKPNTSYTFSGRVKAQGVLGTNAPVLRLVEADAAGNWIKASQITFEKGTYDWVLKSMNVVTSPSTSIIYITSYLENSYGTYWLDDVNVTSETDVSCPALQAMLTVYPTTLKNGESFKFISMAIGGQSGTYTHEILLDKSVLLYNSGAGQGITFSDFVMLSGNSTGLHTIVSKITDTCSSPQTAISNVVSIIVEAEIPIPIKYSCAGAPNYTCYEDVNGAYSTLTACQNACKSTTEPPIEPPTEPPTEEPPVILYVAIAGMMAAILYLIMRRK